VSALRLLCFCILLSGCGSAAAIPADQPPVSLSVVSGNSQSGVAGTELLGPLIIKAADGSGVASAGVTVNFMVTSGGGSVFAGAAVTDNNGIAEDYWTLGTSTAQMQTLEVRAVTSTGQKELFAVFTATAFAGPAAQIAVQVGDTQSVLHGTMVSVAPAVRVTDQYGNPVANKSVTFAVGVGGGTVAGAIAVTDATGIASVGSWTLGPVGPNSLTATAAGSGISGNPIAVHATSVAWLAKASMPTPREGLAVGVVNGILYAVGGYNSAVPVDVGLGTVEAYDPIANSWTTKAPMPTPRSRFSVGVVNGVLYAVGGVNGTGNLGTVEAYDPVANSWTTMAPMPTPREELAVGVVNGLLYAIGGAGNNGPLATVEAYDPSTNSWTTKAPIPTPLGMLSTGVVNNLIYAVSSNETTGVVEVYDPASNSWSTAASLPTSRELLSVGVVNGILYAVGGTYAGTTWVGIVEAYDPVAHSWTTQPSMPTPRYGLSVGAWNGILYALGGYSTSGFVGTNEAFLP
jgi:energy-converting hydrogenase Eha subunit A